MSTTIESTIEAIDITMTKILSLTSSSTMVIAAFRGGNRDSDITLSKKLRIPVHIVSHSSRIEEFSGIIGFEFEKVMERLETVVLAKSPWR